MHIIVTMSPTLPVAHLHVVKMMTTLTVSSEVSAVVATSVSVSVELSARAYVVEGAGRWW
jgi:hypothetical protein